MAQGQHYINTMDRMGQLMSYFQRHAPTDADDDVDYNAFAIQQARAMQQMQSDASGMPGFAPNQDNG